jgi:hypothetical protein
VASEVPPGLEQASERLEPPERSLSLPVFWASFGLTVVVALGLTFAWCVAT